jgi:hypothetical protein
MWARSQEVKLRTAWPPQESGSVILQRPLIKPDMAVCLLSVEWKMRGQKST